MGEIIGGGKETEKVLASSANTLGFDPDPNITPLPEQYQIVENYLWDNVVRMRDLNPHPRGAQPFGNAADRSAAHHPGLLGQRGPELQLPHHLLPGLILARLRPRRIAPTPECQHSGIEC